MFNGVVLIKFVLVNVLSIFNMNHLASHVLTIKPATHKYLLLYSVVGDNVDHDET